MKMEQIFDPDRSSPTGPSFPHAFSGNPGGIRTGPPIKTFGGDGLAESHLFTSPAIFERVHDAKTNTLNTGVSHGKSKSAAHGYVSCSCSRPSGRRGRMVGGRWKTAREAQADARRIVRSQVE